MLLRDAAVGLLAILATPVFVNEPPRFNIEATCRAAQPLGPEIGHPTTDVCATRTRRDRSSSDNGLGTPTSIHRHALPRPALGAYPSYVEVLT
jgi:hypothetical protein